MKYCYKYNILNVASKNEQCTNIMLVFNCLFKGVFFLHFFFLQFLLVYHFLKAHFSF